jgi:hypothetical protein
MSFPPRIRVRDKLQRESSLLDSGFRGKPGMTNTKSEQHHNDFYIKKI